MNESAPLILGVSGLRGIVGQSLTPDVAMRYAAAFGTWLGERTEWRPMVIVGNDGRAGAAAITQAAIAGLLATGCRVTNLGTATTPSVGVGVDMRDASAAIMITASHNPQQWNGLKLLVAERRTSHDTDNRGSVDGYTPSVAAPPASVAAEIIERYHAGSIAWVPADQVGSHHVDTDVEDPHCLRVLNALESLLSLDDSEIWTWFEERGSYRVVTDEVNASATLMNRFMFQRTCVHLVQLHGDGSGMFPHTPEPTRENLSAPGGLCDAVPGLKADVGFAQDPDADRLAIVDEKGRYIGEEYTLALCAEAVLGARASASERGPSASEGLDLAPAHLVANLSTSRMIDDVAAKYGATVHRTPVGEANVVERMKALRADGHNVVLGGEGNGGVIWPEVVYIRDSLSSMALVLALMARTGKKVSELVALIDSYSPGGKGYAIVKRKVDIPSKDAARPAVDAVSAHFAEQRVDLQDGVRIDFDPAGSRNGAWVHVRASNTEPIMRLICEAPTEAIALGLLAETERVIAAE